MLQDHLRNFRVNYIECNNEVGWRRVCSSLIRWTIKGTITNRGHVARNRNAC